MSAAALGNQFIFDLPVRESLDRGDFIESDCNRAALALIDRWPGWASPFAVVHGPAGCGKSHLAAIWRRTSGAALLALSAVTPSTVPELIAGAPLCFRYGDGARLDDLALFHLHNGLAEAGGSALICSRLAPAAWPVGMPDLRTRLGAVEAAGIAPPDDALLGSLLMKQVRDRQLVISDSRLIPYCLSRMDRSFAMARELVAGLDRAALATGRKLTLPLAKEVLDSLTDAGEAPPDGPAQR